MMMTWEEVKEALAEGRRIKPDEFERIIADDLPQTIVPQILTDMFDYFRQYEGLPPHQAANHSATYMSGFQAGWMLKAKVMSHGS
jgi:hypothetical protein